MEWLLELALLGLLVATLFHAVRLERALGVLKRDRGALEALVSEFNASTRLAEQGIERLRSAADGAGRQIARQTETASGLKDDLLFLIQRGETLADRLDASVRAGRSVVQDMPAIPQPAPFGHSGRYAPEHAPLSASDRSSPEALASPLLPRPWPPDTRASEPPSGRPEADSELSRVRSQAERDLLRALRLAR